MARRTALFALLLALIPACLLLSRAQAAGHSAPMVTVLPFCNPTLRIQNPNSNWMFVRISHRNDERWIRPSGSYQTPGLGRGFTGNVTIHWEVGAQHGNMVVQVTAGDCNQD